jgi:hypothetical protein
MNPLAVAGRAGVRTIDRVLLRYYRIFPYSHNPQCVLRLSAGRSSRELALSDGTRVARGEPVLILHFWNEHIPASPREGLTLAWSINFFQRVQLSLRELALFLEDAPQFDSVHVLGSEMGFLEFSRFPEMEHFLQRLGFDFIPGEAPGWRIWRYAFWANLFSWWLMWTFNPASLRGKHFTQMARSQVWISRARLTTKYGGTKNEDAHPRF